MKTKTSFILFLGPALVIYTIFRMGPALASLAYSFTNWDGLSKTYEYVGLSNYIEAFRDELVLTSIKNTILYSVIVVLFQNGLGLFFAVLLDKQWIRGKNFFRVVLFLPAVLNTAAICFIWATILSPTIGVWGNVMTFFHLNSILPYDLLGSSDTALITVALVNIWQYIGYSMVIYLAGLQAVSKDYYEAASIDGCSQRKMFWKITLPLIAPSITINTILTTVGTLKEFEHVYSMTGGGPGNASHVMGTAIYQVAFGNTQRFGYGIAISTLLMLAVCIVTVLQRKIIGKAEMNSEN
ncbi:MAG: sugar ABC transporter permease [Acetatifactor sp.]|jgi:raffinose/stachyose/melibiose transport system permease protein|nr:sugar ABC transporter permease [Acetatifactor sp.]